MTDTERNLLYGYTVRIEAETKRARTAADPSKHLANVERLKGYIREMAAEAQDTTPFDALLLKLGAK